MGWGRGVLLVGEGGEKAEILDFFVELGGGLVRRWTGWDHIFIHVGQVRHLLSVGDLGSRAVRRVWVGRSNSSTSG